MQILNKTQNPEFEVIFHKLVGFLGTLGDLPIIHVSRGAFYLSISLYLSIIYYII